MTNHFKKKHYLLHLQPQRIVFLDFCNGPLKVICDVREKTRSNTIHWTLENLVCSVPVEENKYSSYQNVTNEQYQVCLRIM